MAVFATHDAHLITIFLAGNDIDLMHKIMIVIFNIFFHVLINLHGYLSLKNIHSIIQNDIVTLRSEDWHDILYFIL